MKKYYKLFFITSVLIAGILVVNFTDLDLTFAQNKKVQLGAKKSETKIDPQLKNFNNLFVSVSKEATNKVVSIVVTAKLKANQNQQMEEFFHQFPGMPDFKIPKPKDDDLKSQGSGSGIIVTADGYILTNNHVIENATENGIEIITNDTKRYKAKLIGTDPLTDIAVLKIDAKDLSPAKLGNSDELQVGEWVLAIGTPLGLNSTVTAGIVSYLGRRIDIINDSYGVENFIQTDAAINPGNSGGALVNLNGEVIGINTAIATTNARYQGYGFAIPINLAINVAEDLIENGKIERGYIGVQIQSVDETIAKASGLKKAEGVLVQDVLENGAAKNAGIVSGDIILTVDGKEVKTANELQAFIASKRVGDLVELVIWRDNKKVTKNVKLKARDSKGSEIALNDGESLDESTENETTKNFKFEKLGFSVSVLNSRVKNERKVDGGVLVSDVEKFTEASERGIQNGDIILEADKKQISNIQKLKDIIESKKNGDALMLRLKDKNNLLKFVALEIQ